MRALTGFHVTVKTARKTGLRGLRRRRRRTTRRDKKKINQGMCLEKDQMALCCTSSELDRAVDGLVTHFAKHLSFVF